MALVGRHIVPCGKRTLKHISHHSGKRLYPLVTTITSSQKDGPNKTFECNLVDKRDFHTTCINRNPEKENEPFVKIFNFKNPFSFISLKIKLFLLRSYFDGDFNEDEFIKGAKQAVSYVSTKISEGKINELDHVLTSQGIQSSRDLYFDNERNPSIIRVGMEDFLNISLIDVGFEYGEGTKHANVLVVALCMHKEGASRKIGNIEVVTMPTKVVKYSSPCEKKEKILRKFHTYLKFGLSYGRKIKKPLERFYSYDPLILRKFRREYTPGAADGSDWLVDNMEQTTSTDLF